MGNEQSRARLPKNYDTSKAQRTVGKRASISLLQRLDSRVLSSRPTSSTNKNADDEDQVLIAAAPQAIHSHPLQSHPLEAALPDLPVPSPSSTATVLRASSLSDPFSDLRDTGTTSGRSSGEVLIESLAEGNVGSDGGHLLANSPVHSRYGTEDNTSTTSQTPRSDKYSGLYLHQDDDELAILSADSTSEEEGSGPRTPLAEPRDVELTPVLRIPTPLACGSPPLYAADEMMDLDYANAHRLPKHRATTVTGLFHVSTPDTVSIQTDPGQQAAEQLRASNSRHAPPKEIVWKDVETLVLDSIPPCEIHQPISSTCAPSELFLRAHKRASRASLLAEVTADTRDGRVRRRPYPENLVSHKKAANGQSVALPLPLSECQKECHTRHDLSRQISILTRPVECGVCLVYPADGKVYMCTHCSLMFCGNCKHILDNSGPTAMASRHADGSETIQARKTMHNRQSS